MGSGESFGWHYLGGNDGADEILYVVQISLHGNVDENYHDETQYGSGDLKSMRRTIQYIVNDGCKTWIRLKRSDGAIDRVYRPMSKKPE